MDSKTWGMGDHIGMAGSVGETSARLINKSIISRRRLKSVAQMSIISFEPSRRMECLGDVKNLRKAVGRGWRPDLAVTERQVIS